MLFNSILALGASLTLAAAAPAPVASADTTTPTQYYLRSTHATHPRHNKLYVSSYHTGAGAADVVFTNSTDEALTGFLDVDAWTFTNLGFPAGLTMGGDVTEFHNVTINVGESDGRFGTGKYFGWDNEAFGYWLICDWWWGVPQLFWLDSNTAAPKGCSTADLVLELA